MKKFIVFIFVLLSGCATFGVRESQIIKPDGKIYKVLCQSDGKLDYKDDEITISIDNRGKPGFLEQIFGVTAMGFAGVTNAALKEGKPN